MSAKKKHRIRKWVILGVIAVVVTGVVAAYLMRPAQSIYESVKSETGDITTYYSFSGNVETKNRQIVMAEKVMQVSKINIKEGSVVKEGDVLMETTTGDQIKAEIDGEIVNLAVEENAQVMGGIKLLDIVDYNNLQISVKVDEYDLAAVEKGSETTVKIGALDKEIKGTIRGVSKEGIAVNGVTFFTATIDLAKDASLKVGMSAEVKLQSDKVTGAVTLPMSAIQFDQNNNPYVLKEGEKGKAVKAEITTGIQDGVTVEIKSGVKAGETILYPKADTTQKFGFGGGRNKSSSAGGGN